MRALTTVLLTLWTMTLGAVVYLLMLAPSPTGPAVVEVHVPQPKPAAAIEPYGGCDEAYLYPKSEGAQWCRDHADEITPDSPYYDSYVAELFRND